MAIDESKEAMKVAVETSGHFSALWQWALGCLGGGVALLWRHVTGRIKKLENTLVTSADLKKHIDDEDEKFKILFGNYQRVLDELTAIGKSVARIEGKLEQ